jgi:hypothetical protein
MLAVPALAGAAHVASATPFSDAVDALNPVGYWQGEGNFDDSTAKANHLTPFGGATTTTEGPGLPGLPGDAMDFRHAGGQRGATVATGAGNSLNLSGATAYTINAWVANNDDTGSFRMIATERDATWAASAGANTSFATYRWGVGTTSGTRTYTQGNIATVEGYPIYDAGWHMLTAVVTLGSTAEFYIDGASVGSTWVGGGAALAGDGEWFVVANNSFPAEADWAIQDFDGRIDELAVFGAALSAAQISNLYAAAFIPGPVLVASTNAVVDDVLGTSFGSEFGATHRLQSTPDLVSVNFSDTGAMAIGSGADMTLYDPTGASTSKSYRVTQD